VPTWDANQYLQFEGERTRPCRELAARVQLDSPNRIIDLGCGPGNSTAVLAQRWPNADITGLDSSPDMIETATRESPNRRWVLGDIAEYARGDGEKFDLVFSNAALQWVEDHATLFPRLMDRVAPGGALAVQVPGNLNASAHVAAREISELTAWRWRFPAGGVRGTWAVRDLPFYYDTLSPKSSRLDLWTTEYQHVMPSPEAIVEWYKGTGLRPYLEALPNDADRQAFLNEYLQSIQKSYTRRPDGKVLFPFLRLFIVAYR
jgi:trans-aconitate 2-methyltransferase